jgi:hypothetical protein
MVCLHLFQLTIELASRKLVVLVTSLFGTAQFLLQRLIFVYQLFVSTFLRRGRHRTTGRVLRWLSRSCFDRFLSRFEVKTQLERFQGLVLEFHIGF